MGIRPKVKASTGLTTKVQDMFQELVWHTSLMLAVVQFCISAYC